MIRISIIFCFLFLSSLGYGQPDKYYIAHNNFGGICNQIELSKLDSLISKIPYKRFVKDPNYSNSVNTAISILTERFNNIKLVPANFFIMSIANQNDSIISFRLTHLDSYIYYHNLKIANKKLAAKPIKKGVVQIYVPASGNVSGYDGLYNVDIKYNEIRIYYDE